MKERKKSYINRLLAVYCLLFRKKFNFNPMVSFPRFGKAMKELMVSHSESQITALFIVFFDWYGVDGASQYEQNKLVEASFNPQWFLSCVNTYEVYLRNFLGVNIDNEQELERFIKDNLPTYPHSV